MAYVDEITGVEAYDWDNSGVYQIEETDPVQGGVGGISNAQALELAKRTRNLHSRLNTVIGNVPEAYNTLEKIANAIEALDFSEINLDELKAELRGNVSAALDTMKEIVDYIDALQISFNDLTNLPEFQGKAEVTGSVIDWAGKPERWKELLEDTEFSATNLIEGKTIGLKVTGAHAATFTSMFNKAIGSPSPLTTATNYIQMKCINATAGSELIVYTVMYLP